MKYVNEDNRPACIVASSKMAAYLLEQAPSLGYDPEQLKNIIVICEAFEDDYAYTMDYEDLCQFIEDHSICFKKPAEKEEA